MIKPASSRNATEMRLDSLEEYLLLEYLLLALTTSNSVKWLLIFSFCLYAFHKTSSWLCVHENSGNLCLQRLVAIGISPASFFKVFLLKIPTA